METIYNKKNPHLRGLYNFYQLLIKQFFQGLRINVGFKIIGIENSLNNIFRLTV